ncbi:MAG: Gmad2 immunoglobulin-like domain-containing protein [Terricaulis sp.]|nr:Gmad2 immunoglobulin-like domain-containing protein [Terricaulis sp.]
MPLRHLAALTAALALAACAPEPAPAPEPPAPSAAPPVLDTPQEGAAARSPLMVSGAAPADWFFEEQFPTLIMDADGRVLAEAPALAQAPVIESVDGMVRFRAQLAFVVTQDTPATLVLQEDMPQEGAPARETRLSVTLQPPLR